MQKPEYNERVITILRARWPVADYARINGAHEDVFALIALARQFQTLRHARKIEKFAGMRMLSALHKSILQASVVYFAIFIHEISGRPTKDVSLQKFVKLPKVVRSRKYKDFLGAYCIEIYRNKLVAHNGVYRIAGSTVDANGTFKLSPTGLFQNRLKGRMRTIRRLAKAAGIGCNNYHETLGQLFYLVGLPRDWDAERGRKEVDGLIEQIGCDSPCVDTIERFVDEFSLACVELPKRIGRRIPRSQRVVR
jgi:hypothetical protein